VMCVLGSFPSSRFPKPTRPGIILRCLHITGIPRKKRNKAEVVFCHILDVTRAVMFCFPYTLCVWFYIFAVTPSRKQGLISL